MTKRHQTPSPPEWDDIAKEIGAYRAEFGEIGRRVEKATSVEQVKHDLARLCYTLEKLMTL